VIDFINKFNMEKKKKIIIIEDAESDSPPAPIRSPRSPKRVQTT
jgi:hypothetical protein